MKEYKLFNKKDIIVYLLLLVFIAVLFASFLLPKVINTPKDCLGFKVTINGKTIIKYEFGKSDYYLADEWKDDITTYEKDGNRYFKVSFGETYNLIMANQKNRSVKMVESTCSHSQDCKFLPAIKNTGSIYCQPHDLKITPISPSMPTVG